MAEIPAKPRLVGINHVALEVDDVDETLDFLGRIFEFEVRSRGDGRAFIDLGDQFIALFEGGLSRPDTPRHFGLVVEDKEAVRRRLQALGIELRSGRFLEFSDPSGNRIQIIGYADIQFTKAPEVLRGMGLAHLSKSGRAMAELREKGMAQ